MKNNWLPLAMTLAIQALVAWALLTLPVMAPVVGKAIGVSPTYVGLYVALAYAGAAICARTTSGSLNQRGGSRRTTSLKQRSPSS